ncbi:riboflavin deaminase [Martelella alba]|uniref:Riboflavin deaminase n=1 Tax=Martelella alba TaxID=2590451 RepID=A0A506U3E0_9HYPH|nr:dihydrofolate reductase family protein [Martelella alba]TPW27801.1 riboflavin deaminase [Martelella alba]
MQSVDVSPERWAQLLARRNRALQPQPVAFDTADAACALYGPIADAGGPFVLAQVGQSLDGRVATQTGDARDISGPDGLKHLHRCRALVDAVIVGINTIKADNPRLSVRLVTGQDPVRVVIDCHAALDGSEGLFHDGGANIVVFQSVEAPLRAYANAEVIRLRPTAVGLDPGTMLERLNARGLTRILVEGGARTIRRFIAAGRVDRLHVAVAPLIIGSGPSGLSLAPTPTLAEALRPPTTVYDLGSDTLFDCSLRPATRSVR